MCVKLFDLNFWFLVFILKEDLADLKEQITLYESAVKHGVVALDLSSDWENQLSESCVDLGLKKTNRKNGLHHRYIVIMCPFFCVPCRIFTFFITTSVNNHQNVTWPIFSTALAHLSDSKLPKDEAMRLLRVEMQRCLCSLKGKRQKISQLQEELQLCQGRVNELQTKLDDAKLSSSVRARPDTSFNTVLVQTIS